MPKSYNDINVHQWTPLFAKLVNVELPPAKFQANCRTYNMGYYLADGIYPKWATFVKPISGPQGKKELYFHNAQAVAMKDTESAFGIFKSNLQLCENQRFGIKRSFRTSSQLV